MAHLLTAHLAVLQTLREAARRSVHGIAWAGERSEGGAVGEEGAGGRIFCHDWAFAIKADSAGAHVLDNAVERLWGERGGFTGKVAVEGGRVLGRECPVVIGDGLSPPHEFSDVVVLEWQAKKTVEQGRNVAQARWLPGSQSHRIEHAPRVVSILRQNRLFASAPQTVTPLRGENVAEEGEVGMIGELRRAVEEARVVIVVVGHFAATEREGENQTTNAYVCEVLMSLATSHGRGGRRASAVFGLALDEAAVPVCEKGAGGMGVQWFHKKTPLHTSVAIDQVHFLYECIVFVCLCVAFVRKGNLDINMLACCACTHTT